MFSDKKYIKFTKYLKENLSEKRYNHSLNVAKEAYKLADINQLDKDKAYLAGLLHDICKEMPDNQQKQLVDRSMFEVDEIEYQAKKLWHGIAGAQLVLEKFGIYDIEILSGIRYHTVAKDNMTDFEKIIYLADLVSCERSFDGVEKIREIIESNLDDGMTEAIKFSINSLVLKSKTIPIITLKAYNQYITKK